MRTRHPFALTTLLCLLLSPVAVLGQQQSGAGEESEGAKPAAPTREEIFHSDRWRRLERSLEEWWSVQKIYTAEEVENVLDKVRLRVATMSVPELEDFIYDTEERLAVLMSEQAANARAYLRAFTQEARRQLVAAGGEVPDVFEMTVSQLREELRQFEQERAARTSAQAAFNRGQSRQAAAIAQRQQAQRAQMEQSMRDSRARQAQQVTRGVQRQRQQPVRSPYAPSRPTIDSLDVARWEVLRGLRGF